MLIDSHYLWHITHPFFLLLAVVVCLVLQHNFRNTFFDRSNEFNSESVLNMQRKSLNCVYLKQTRTNDIKPLKTYDLGIARYFAQPYGK